jgi:hypothetical protein
MAEFISFDPAVEVTGEGIGAFVAGFPVSVRAHGWQILKKHGLDNVSNNQFYPLQAWLDAMKEISQSLGSQLLVRIGEAVSFSAVLPPNITGLKDCLESMDVAYHMNHRHGEIGSYRYTDLGVQGGLARGKMVCHNPYPCAFDNGVFEGFAKRFPPAGGDEVLVRHDDSEPCRHRGGESCTYILTWA